MLTAIQNLLTDMGLVTDTWDADTEAWGARVLQYRLYVDSDHELSLTTKMQAMLRTDEGFTANMCELIVDAATSRISLLSMVTDDEAETAWAENVMLFNDWPILESAINSATVRDGDTFGIVSWSEQLGMFIIYHELAYDGTVGMIPIYTEDSEDMAAAIKIWAVVQDNETVYRVNLYLADRIERYIMDGEELTPYPDKATFVIPNTVTGDENADVLGLPVIHYRSKRRAQDLMGRSKLSGLIGLQDALNRIIVSMVMTGEFSAFPVKVAKNFIPATTVEPGMIVTIDETELAENFSATFEQLPGTDLMPYIDEINLMIHIMGIVSSTPLPDVMGNSTASGEALKQREAGLVAYVKDFQVTQGGAWIATWEYGIMLHNTYGKQTVSSRFTPSWLPADVRSDEDLIKSAVVLEPLVGTREALRIAGRASFLQYDNDKIDMIFEERSEDMATLLSGIAGREPNVP